MTVKYGKFKMPEQALIEENTASPTFGRVIAGPLEQGFGHTIGNTMRRTMLSSLEAPAIVSVRIEGVPHEYTAIEGVIEDMTNIILNIKGALLRKLTLENDPSAREMRILTTVLKVNQEDIDKGNGQYIVTLGDIVKDGSYETVNPELPIFTVTKPFHRQIDLRVAQGRGYVPTERLEINDRVTDEILIDAVFSPVRLVKYYVENTRVGQDTDFDQLVLEVTTDGRVTPQEAVSFAAQIIVKHFEVFEKLQVHDLIFAQEREEVDENQDEIMDKLCLRIDEIELSVRSTNCLSGANIETIAELVSIPERRMLEFRNFGKKSLNEIKAKLHEMGLGLGMDLSRYGITADNVKERVSAYIEEKKNRQEQA